MNIMPSIQKILRDILADFFDSLEPFYILEFY